MSDVFLDAEQLKLTTKYAKVYFRGICANPSCGREYYAIAPNQKFCSLKCKKAYEHAVEAESRPFVQKICPVCGSVFFTRKTNKIYCSAACCGRYTRLNGLVTAAARKRAESAASREEERMKRRREKAEAMRVAYAKAQAERSR